MSPNTDTSANETTTILEFKPVQSLTTQPEIHVELTALRLLQKSDIISPSAYQARYQELIARSKELADALFGDEEEGGDIRQLLREAINAEIQALREEAGAIDERMIVELEGRVEELVEERLAEIERAEQLEQAGDVELAEGRERVLSEDGQGNVEGDQEAVDGREDDVEGDGSQRDIFGVDFWR